jgi:hypothetical protein
MGAEAWCVDQLSVPASDLPPNEPVSLRLDVRTEDLERRSRENTESGLSLTDLVDILSRTGRISQPKWTFESTPFRPADLKAGTG